MTLMMILEALLRTTVVAALAGLGLALFRVRSSTVKLAVWRLVLYASLLMPLASLTLPRRVVVVPAAPAPVAMAIERAKMPFAMAARVPFAIVSAPIDWQGAALRAYALVAAILLLRAALGLLRLRQIGASAVPLPDLGPEVFETSNLAAPVTYGVVRPRILLPNDWHTWTDETLDAVLAHERAHIAQRDFLTQLLSKFNRALYWANPISWWMDRQLAQLAEHSSDDAALSNVLERPAYAGMLLGFAERRTNPASAGVAMARRGGMTRRIERILDEARSLSQPLSLLSRPGLATIVLTSVVIISVYNISTVTAQSNSKPDTTWWLSGHDQQEWVLVTPQGTSMSGGNGAMARAKSYLSKTTASDYLWFSRGGQEYLIEDPKTVAEIGEWFKPMEELGRLQAELGQRQGVLGEQMAKLGEEMAKLGDQMSKVQIDMPDMKKLKAEIARLNKMQAELGPNVSVDALSELQSRLGELQGIVGEAQSLVGGKQSSIGELQGKLGDKQGLLGQQQGKLGEMQGRLGEQQGKIAEEAERKLHKLFDQSIQDGQAKPVR